MAGRVDRRLAAILVGDVVSYSRLMAADEEGTLSRLNAHRREFLDPKIAEHRGRIVKRTGDGVLIEFGSAVDAGRCAVEIQQGMFERNAHTPQDKRIELRIGIHIGDIIVEEGDIFGDGVNVAARLEGIAKPGGVTISDDIYRQIRGKIEEAFEDTGERELKNIGRPIRVYEWKTGGVAVPAPTLALPNKPSIAVLPFQNLSDDSAQGYYVDGIVEDITIALSQFSQLFVVARSSSFTYKGRNVDVKQVGQELGVRYVLEGSIRKAAGQVRITAQLINSPTAVQLWAAHFDGTLDQVFDLQDQVTSGVVGVIAPKIEHVEIERAKRKPTGSLDAYDYYLHGLASLYQDTREANDEALRLFGKAIELDHNFATAYGMLALCYVGRHWKRWVVEEQKEVNEVACLVNRVAELGRDDAMALSAAGMAAGLVVHDLDRATVLLDRSLLLNPNLAASWVRSSWVRIFLGQFDLAIEHANRAIRLSPLDPLLVGMQSAIAFAHFCAGRYDQSAMWAVKAMKEQPNFGAALRVLAASSASLGRMKEATEALERLKGTKGLFRISELWHFPFREPKYFASYAEALRKAGFPE